MIVLTVIGGSVVGQPLADEAHHPAVRWLGRGMRVGPNGQQHVILRALSDLRDPRLQPLFHALAGADHPALRIHGILGLARISEDHAVNLKRIASIENPAVQGTLVSAALDADLLDPSPANAMLDWRGLDVGVKLLICSRRIGHGRFDRAHQSILRQGAESQRLGRRALAQLLLLQLGEHEQAQGLWQLNRPTPANAYTADSTAGQSRDAVRMMLLRSVQKHGLHHAKAWAYAVAQSQPPEASLGMFALRLAMRFGSRQAQALWAKRLAAIHDPILETRYAMLALRIAPWLEADVFKPLLTSERPVIRRMAKTGRAIANAQPTIGEQVVKLIQTHHPLVGPWALQYARDHGRAGQKRMILLALIKRADGGPDAGRDRRRHTAAEAARVLYEQEAKAAVKCLGPILSDDQTPQAVKRAVLRGLVGAKPKPTAKLLASLRGITGLEANAFKLLLRVRAGAKLTRVDLADLRVLVRGGANLSPTLRTQAAWWYLQRTGQAKRALSTLINLLHRQ